MNRMHIAAAVALSTVVSAIAAAPAVATPPEGEVERTDLAEGTTTAPIWIVTAGQPTTLTVQSLVLKPGASSGWHAHPGPEHSVVNSGSVLLRTAPGCAPVTYGPKESVFIPAGTPHEVVNQATEDAEVLVTYTLPANVAARDDAPAMCP
ncbi:cupin domain-containing protein [Mycolicibacterium goodii]|uniref:Cupin domain-containing protein n=1 Tax=Mycolicibacterium goodii TaxID=134601 RepID=A0ABS6HUA1_MYCGD|nr:cupin domain-containing protein [Mycolicibacterium goodii]MBU8825798.1 cupin domain-containing protein [Mycolicibacterium goodii]MBU8840816.1 cupin domain-containing protein [Mycolicibacterium goodii]ULN48405.1 cupin domain-containing protein [Mycolicibacterium goodii]